MELFLQIIGTIAISIIIIITAIYLYIRIKLGKYANIDLDKDMTPLVIHLNEEFNPDWLGKKNAIHLEKELLDLGFTIDKAYNVVEMDDMRLVSYFNAPYTAVMYTHPVAGLWVDMVGNIENGTEYYVSNAPMGGELDTPPNTEKYWLKDFSPKELFSKLKEVTTSHTIKALDSSSFRDYFENSYKKEMQWKNKNGGISFEEVLRIVENDPKTYSDVEITESFNETKRKELHKWHNGAIEEYKAKEKIVENDCQDIFEYLFIVPIKTDPIGFIRYLNDMYYLHDDQASKLEEKYKAKDIEIKTLFSEINNSFSPELRANKKADIDYPIDIEIYEISKNNI